MQSYIYTCDERKIFSRLKLTSQNLFIIERKNPISPATYTLYIRNPNARMKQRQLSAYYVKRARACYQFPYYLDPCSLHYTTYRTYTHGPMHVFPYTPNGRRELHASPSHFTGRSSFGAIKLLNERRRILFPLNKPRLTN